MITTYKERSFFVNGKGYYPFKNVLIFDIETTNQANKRITAENVKIKIWGAFSYNTGTVLFGKGHNFQDLVDKHDILVGHNIKSFDIPVLEKQLGINFKGKIIIDTLETLRKPPSKSEKEAYLKKGKKAPSGKGRSIIIGEARQSGMIDNRFPNLKLSTIAKHGYKLFGNHPIYKQFFSEYKQDDFDYSVLNKKNITEDDWLYIKDYLRQDLIVTKNIFEFLERYFESLAENLSEEDIKRLDYMHAPTGSYFYKCICHDLKLPFTFGDANREKFPGAKVLLPTQEEYGPEDGDGYCIDWASQHPHNIWSANLATPVSKCTHKVDGKCPNPYSGDGKIFKLTGTYCSCEMGKIEKWLRMMYFRRNYFKRKYVQPNGKHISFKDTMVGDEVYYINKNRDLVNINLTTEDIVKARRKHKEGIDPREYSIKILINSGYGVLSSPVFESIYCPTTGPDTTLMSQQSTMFMVNWMKSKGYIVTYGDTDSCYIMDPFRNKETMLKNMADGVQQIKDALPFVDATYNMDVDAEFSNIFFIPEMIPIEVKSKEKDYAIDLFGNKIETKKKRKKCIKKLVYKKKNYIYILKPNKEGKVKVKIMGIPILKKNASKLAKKIYMNYLEDQIIKTKKIKFPKEYLRQLVRFEIEKDINILAVEIKVNPADSYAKTSQIQYQISKNYFDGGAGMFVGIKHTKDNLGVGKGKHYCSLEEAKTLGIDEYDLETVWKSLEPFTKEDVQNTIYDYEVK